VLLWWSGLVRRGRTRHWRATAGPIAQQWGAVWTRDTPSQQLVWARMVAVGSGDSVSVATSTGVTTCNTRQVACLMPSNVRPQP